jgi:hypothetical protein
MKYFDKLLQEVDEGREGKKRGIYYNKPRLESVIGPIQRKYYLIFAATKVGKTSFTDEMMMYEAFNYVLKNPEFNYTVDYYSFEMPIVEKLAGFAIRTLWLKHGLRVNKEDLLSMRKNKLSDDIYKLFKETREYYEPLEDKIRYFDEGTPKSINSNTVKLLKDRGTINVREVVNNESQTVKVFDSFKWHKDLDFHNVIVDHAALTDNDSGSTPGKITIDELSKVLNRIRQRYGATVTLIQQQNFEQTAPERQNKIDLVTPRLSDLGDSKYTSRDAQVAISLFSPYSILLKEHDGFDILTRWKDSYRQLEIQATRNSSAGQKINLYYDGMMGMFHEIPINPFNATIEEKRIFSEITQLPFQNSDETPNSRAEWFRKNYLANSL